jgi:putative endonuclease
MTTLNPAVYMLASKKYGTLYVGVTGNLLERVYIHKEKLSEGFTQKYDVNFLVYFEFHEDMPSAITREKQIKKWRREWRFNLIASQNPEWKDLYDQLV